MLSHLSGSLSAGIKEVSSMGYSLNITQADAVLEKLRKDYRVFAPRRFPKQGRYSDTDIVRYAEVERFSDIVWDVKSDYPAKEVLTPIQQTIFYFTEDESRASKVAAKPILLLARPCDINAQKIQARIYAGNGGYDDFYYTRMRELVTFALMECGGGDDTCFCVSMGTNRMITPLPCASHRRALSWVWRMKALPLILTECPRKTIRLPLWRKMN